MFRGTIYSSLMYLKDELPVLERWICSGCGSLPYEKWRHISKTNQAIFVIIDDMTTFAEHISPGLLPLVCQPLVWRYGSMSHELSRDIKTWRHLFGISLNLVPRVLSLLRESTPVVAGHGPAAHVFKHANPTLTCDQASFLFRGGKVRLIQ